jgi:hypothetical protein
MLEFFLNKKFVRVHVHVIVHVHVQLRPSPVPVHALSNAYVALKWSLT